MGFTMPNFRSSMMGYNKSDVTAFLTRTESEMETFESRQAAADKTIASMKGEIQTLTRRLEVLTEENCNLESSNAELRKAAYDYDENFVAADEHQKVLTENSDLKAQLDLWKKKAEEEPKAEKLQQLLRENEELRQANAALKKELESGKADYEALQTECSELRSTASSTEKDLKAIQDALISAQRMSEIVMSEARAEAERLTEQAQQSAAQTLDEAQQRNLALQQSYDRMLMDTSKMKSELIDLYRRHLALLSEIPGQEEVPLLEDIVLETVND